MTPPEEGPALAMAQLEEIAAPTSLGEVVFERLRDAIIDKSLPPGARVAEWAIAEQLGVSRTPVRETLWRLRQMGLIELAGRKGYRVAYPSRHAIEQAYELREALEGFAAGAAAERASDAELQVTLDAANASLVGAANGDIAEFLRWDAKFHEGATQLAGNARLKMLVDDSWALVMTLRSRDFLYERASLECGRAHVEIGEAMVRRERPLVEQLMRLHIQQVRDYVLKADEARQKGALAEPA